MTGATRPRQLSSAPSPRSFLDRWLTRARDYQSRALFASLRRYCHGHVLDVGGWDFIETAKGRGVRFDTWTTIEPMAQRSSAIADARFRFVVGDGCRMPFREGAYDTVLNVQVLEHVFEPIDMVLEIARVLKIGGHAVFLIPQSNALHMAPHHYYNFTRYWIREAASRAGLDIVSLTPIGGRWASTASHLIYFFLQAFRAPGRVPPEVRRSAAFYCLLPLMFVYALVSIPVCLVLSLGDLEEEASNHLVVAIRRERAVSARREMD